MDQKYRAQFDDKMTGVTNPVDVEQRPRASSDAKTKEPKLVSAEKQRAFSISIPTKKDERAFSSTMKKFHNPQTSSSNCQPNDNDQPNDVQMDTMSTDSSQQSEASSQHMYQPEPGNHWLDRQYHENDRKTIKRPHELEIRPAPIVDEQLLDRIQGSMIGMALGDALGAHVEFRPHQYLVEHKVTDLQKGGTWGLEKGQFTDDTSMALCLANSLVVCRDFVPYDQLVRYKWWYKNGYMSSTGKCFDIGAATSQSLREFERRQSEFAKKLKIPDEEMDFLFHHRDLLKKFDVYCSEEGVAGNGALMRLAPVPLFFHRSPKHAVEYSGCSGQITHGDEKALDACRYYGALIVAAVRREPKKKLLSNTFYTDHKNWFGDKPLHNDIEKIANGSYKQTGGYADGIRGKGYIVKALEAALWAFWADEESYEKGALLAVNLGDDTDTTAAIYGQLAGACYGYKQLPTVWRDQVYAKEFIKCLSQWIVYEGQKWTPE